MCGFDSKESSKPVDKSHEPSFFERLFGNVLKNFELSITNLHIRYEDSITKPGTTFATGITLKEFTIHVCLSLSLSLSLSISIFLFRPTECSNTAL